MIFPSVSSHNDPSKKLKQWFSFCIWRGKNVLQTPPSQAKLKQIKRRSLYSGLKLSCTVAYYTYRLVQERNLIIRCKPRSIIILQTRFYCYFYMYFCFLFYEKKINSNLLFTDHFLRSFLNLRKVSKGANFKEVQPMCISSDIIPTYPSRTFFFNSDIFRNQ